MVISSINFNQNKNFISNNKVTNDNDDSAKNKSKNRLETLKKSINSDKPKDTNNKRRPEELSPEVQETLIDAPVAIYGGNKSRYGNIGSGAIIADHTRENGETYAYVLTNEHVRAGIDEANGKTHIGLRDKNGDFHLVPAKLVSGNEEFEDRDLVMYRIRVPKNLDYTVLDFADGGVERGDNLYSTGFPAAKLNPVLDFVGFYHSIQANPGEDYNPLDELDVLDATRKHLDIETSVNLNDIYVELDKVLSSNKNTDQLDKLLSTYTKEVWSGVDKHLDSLGINVPQSQNKESITGNPTLLGSIGVDILSIPLKDILSAFEKEQTTDKERLNIIKDHEVNGADAKLAAVLIEPDHINAVKNTRADTFIYDTDNNGFGETILSISHLKVTNPNKDLSGRIRDSDHINIDSLIRSNGRTSGGNSGGPILNNEGELVAILNSGDDHNTNAVDILALESKIKKEIKQDIKNSTNSNKIEKKT